MKELLYWDLVKVMDNKFNLDFETLGDVGEKVENILRNHGLVEQLDNNGKMGLTKKCLKLNMEDVENLLNEYEFELTFENLESVSL